METFVHPPRTGMEAFQMLPEGTLCQLINDAVIVTPTPLIIHQSVCGDIFMAIHQKVVAEKLGETFFLPIDVYLNQKNAYQPDIVFISNERKEIIRENGIYGAPDLVVEILSKGNAAYDKGVKKDVYEQTGVKEYWLISPTNKRCQGFILKGEKFEAIEPTSGQFHIRLLDLTVKF